AAEMGQLDCLHLLLLCGAQVMLTNDDGEAAVDIASRKRHHPCVTLLKRHMQTTVSKDKRRAPLSPLPPPLASSPTKSTSSGYPQSAARSPEVHHSPVAGSPSVRTSPFGSPAHAPAPVVQSPQALAATSPVEAVRSPRGLPLQSGGRIRAEEGDKSLMRSLYAENDAGTEEFDGDGMEDGMDSGTESSDDAGDHHPEPDARQNSGDRSPEGPSFFGRIRQRFFAAPIRADLGRSNMYRYNQELQRWELPPGVQ
ncbi:unnamed protein product, partial [Polarella glacialis]